MCWKNCRRHNMSNVIPLADRPTGAAELKPSHPGETQAGLNRIVVKSVQYGPRPMLFEKDVIVRSRAGGRLFVNVFRPVSEGKFPVVLSADIYGNHSINMAVISTLDTRGLYDTSPFAAWEAADPGFWVPNEYVMIKAALRGSSGSDGVMTPLSLGEAEDYYDIIEWAAAQAWSNGNVGINGVSYLAMAQWHVAALDPPHLKAMIPWRA